MQDFFENVSRYPRYLITFSTGVIYTLFILPLLPLLRRPSSAIALVGFTISLGILLVLTLRGMLGLSPV